MKRIALAATLLTLALAVPARAQGGIAVGAKAPAVVVNDLDGKPVDLGQVIGRKPVFIEFWATWCPVCEGLMPRVRTLQAAYAGKVEFFGVNVTVNQTPRKVRAYLEEHKPPFRTLYDDKGTSVRAYQVPSTSFIVVIDRTGKVVYTGVGSEQKFEDAVKQVAEG